MVLALSMLPLIFHGIFFLVVFNYYVPLAISIGAVYLCYYIIHTSRTTKTPIEHVVKDLLNEAKIQIKNKLK